MLTAQLAQWRLPERELGLAVRRGVHRDRLHRQPHQPARGLGGLGHRRRGQHEGRLAAVAGADAPQPADDQRDVRAEQPAVGVTLVDHHVPQSPQERRPALVGRQDAVVQHVRVGQHPVRVRPHPVPLVRWGVAVVGRRSQPGDAELEQGTQLVTGQRLGRREVQHPRPVVGEDRRQPGQLVGQRLAGRRARRDDDRAARVCQLGRLDLVPPRPVDALLAQPHPQRLGHPAGPVHRVGGARGQPLDMRAWRFAGSGVAEHPPQNPVHPDRLSARIWHAGRCKHA